MKKIAIIGGGAAGMMCAAQILEQSPSSEIHIFEKNKNLGAKVLISGGGRCNVTTGLRDKQQLMKKYIRGADFLKHSLSLFPPQKVYHWFEQHGVPLVIEADNRVFPQSHNGKDIVGVFDSLFEASNVYLHFATPIKTITKPDTQFIVTTPTTQEFFDSVVITTGGNAYRQTGSTGDGYAFAQSLGHTITPLGPSLNSFLTDQRWTHQLSGLSFPNARLRYKHTKETGPLLFTHFGISGPVTFALSAHLAFEEISGKHPLVIDVELDATKNFQSWDNELLEHLEASPKKQLKNVVYELVPQRFADALFDQLKLPSHTKASEVSKKVRQELSHHLHSFQLSLVQRRPGDEFVTAGGVNLSEVDPRTMESLITPGLYFAGEVLDIDGVTGGFNLQSSWATGYCAGTAIANR